MMIRRLVARTLIVIGVAVILAAILAEAIGAKTMVEWSGSVDTRNVPGAAMVVAAFSSSGTVEISVEGAERIYYMTLKGDPMIALRQLSTVNISLVDTTLVRDVRAGIAYGVSGLETNPLLLRALPLLASIIPVNVSTSQVGDVIRVNLTGGTGVLVVVDPAGGEVVFHMTYRVTGYQRVDTLRLILAGFTISLTGIVLYRASSTRRRIAGGTGGE